MGLLLVAQQRKFVDANNIDKTDAFIAVPWNNVEVIVKTSQSGTELGKYTFKWNNGTNSYGGIFPRVQSAYGQCVWWAIKRFWEEKGKEIWAPFYPSSGRTKYGTIYATFYEPTPGDVLICDGTYTHYAFIEDVQDIGGIKEVFISQYNVTYLSGCSLLGYQQKSEKTLYWQTGKWKTTINGTNYWCQFNYYISSPERW